MPPAGLQVVQARRAPDMQQVSEHAFWPRKPQDARSLFRPPPPAAIPDQATPDSTSAVLGHPQHRSPPIGAATHLTPSGSTLKRTGMAAKIAALMSQPS